MRRILRVLASAVVVAGLVAGLVVPPVVAVRPAPRVVVIVGPVGGLTDEYRAIASDAAREAGHWTSEVVTVFSPDATWPAVRRALRGASVVVYLGHGNGFPSPYRDSLYPSTQNGLGLNPVAGIDDDAHQYFGEAYLAREVRLAPHAVVLLHHLCYASGNSEPGLPEGTFVVARQRVDNYAAGWLRAGADAVIADTFAAPGPYLRALLDSSAAIDRIWRRSPTFHDHVVAFPSARTPGFQALIDPTRAGSGFFRSLVWRPGLRASDVVAGAGGTPLGPVPPGSALAPAAPSLASLGVTFRAPALAPASIARSGFVIGTPATLTLAIGTPSGVKLPDRLTLGLRWDPVALDAGAAAGSPAPPAASTAAPGPAVSAGPSAAPSASSGPSASPGPTPNRGSGPAADTVAGEPPLIQLVAPEVLGSVVSTVPGRVRRGRISVTVALPVAPGRYRLVTTVHGADGVAFDASTQALISALIVKVSQPLSATYGVVPTARVAAGESLLLPVRVANDGALPWADRPIVAEDLVDPSVARSHPGSRLVGRWVPLQVDSAAGAAQAPAAEVSARADPGTETTVELALVAPAIPGDYLLILDIDSPLHGSLAAAGVPPAQVRVTVGPAVTPSAP